MKKSTKKIASLLILIAFLGSSFTYAFLSATPSQSEEKTWSAGIFIVIFEELRPIPADVGVHNNTTDKVFTLNSDNIIYKNTTEDVMLKDFFEIWNETFNYTCILEYCNNENNSMRMYVNNVENSDYEYYTIKDKDVIVIDYR